MSNQLDQAYTIARKEEDYEQAIKICDAVIAENPIMAKAFDIRARIHELMSNLSEAVKDMTIVIELEPDEPDYYFNRGRWHLGLGNLSEAVADQTKALEIGNKRDFHYYDETAYFFRAVALLRLARFEDALSDCENVEDDFLMYSTGLGELTKGDVVEEAIAGRNRSK